MITATGTPTPLFCMQRFLGGNMVPYQIGQEDFSSAKHRK